MKPGLFDYPRQAAFGRALPKSKVYAFGKPTRRLRDCFTREIHQITWQYKLAPQTINLPATASVPEIQVFAIELKPAIDQLTEEILRCIDKAIAFPILFEITTPESGLVRITTAYKRPSEADPAKWVVGDYFSTDWLPADTMRSPLPVALDLGGLYEQMLRQLMPTLARPGESMQSLADRQRAIALKQRESVKLQAALDREKQFNRKVQLNAQLRTLTDELTALMDGPSPGK